MLNERAGRGRQVWLHHLAQGLSQLDARYLRRHLALPEGIDFASNDYLALTCDAGLAREVAGTVERVGVGTAASRLLRGHSPLHAEVEAELAAWCQQPAALLYSSGWAANIGLVTALVGKGDTLICDSLLHASLIDAARLSGAERVVVPHGDSAALAEALARPRTGRCLVLTESVWSMDGDLTDLGALLDLADAHDAGVIVDEAHATGLYGPEGAGCVAALGLQQRVVASVHTGGKALGQSGAWVAGPRPLIDWLVNTSRSFVFSTAVSTATAAGLQLARRRAVALQPEVMNLHRRADGFRQRLREVDCDVRGAGSCIVPVVVGSNEQALAVAAALRADGLDVRAVRPPTVPAGTARLRICVHLDHDEAALVYLADRVAHHLRQSQ
jgi:8-amino-7-oxononanoate synthase